MELDNQITAAGFSAFVKCPTKAYLLAISETAPESYFAALHSRISSTYKAMAAPHLFAGAAGGELCSFEQLRNDQNGEIIVRHVDCETAVYDFGRPSRLGNHSPSLSGVTIPVLFVPWEKPDVSDNALACFGALALCQFAGTLPSRATLIYGDSHRRKTVKVESYVSRTRQIIDAIEANWRAQKPPTLVLNKHCTVCDFRSRCRGVAIERDDLSLITAMTTKERAKCAAKGIFTIAQLSYGYRPRRRKRGRPDAERSQKSAKCTRLSPRMTTS
jgi:hypothetical protein